MNSISAQIENYMLENKGKNFSIHDFYYLGPKNIIKSILFRLNDETKLTRVLDGL